MPPEPKKDELYKSALNFAKFFEKAKKEGEKWEDYILAKQDKAIANYYKGHLKAERKLRKFERKEFEAKEKKNFKLYLKYQIKRINQEEKTNKLLTRAREREDKKLDKKRRIQTEGLGFPSRAMGAIFHTPKEAGLKMPKITHPMDALIKSIRGLNRILKNFLMNPLTKFFSMLLDFDAFFEFNRQVNSAAGGLDMMHHALGASALSAGRLDERVLDLADAFKSAGANVTNLVSAAERAEVLAALETFGGKTADLVDDIVGGYNDITIEAVKLGRVTGRAATEIANRMGEISFQTGIAMSDMAKVFAGFIGEADKAQLSQRRFMDAMVSASQAVGLYQYNLFAAQKMLKKMTEDSLVPFGVALQNFEGVIQAFKTMGDAQIVASINFARLDDQFREGISQEQAILQQSWEEAIAGIGDRLPEGADFENLLEMNRGEFNEMIRNATNLSREERDRIEELGLQITEIAPLLKEGNEDALELIGAVQRGTASPRVYAMMLNALTRKYAQENEENFKDAMESTLRLLEGVLGTNLATLRSWQRSIAGDEELLRLGEEQLAQQEFMDLSLNRISTIMREVQGVLESPEKGFEAVMADLVRTIQRALFDIVRKYFPSLLDLSLQMVEGVGWLVDGIGRLISVWSDKLGGEIKSMGEAIKTSAGRARTDLRASLVSAVFDREVSLIRAEQDTVRAEQARIDTAFVELERGISAYHAMDRAEMTEEQIAAERAAEEAQRDLLREYSKTEQTMENLEGEIGKLREALVGADITDLGAALADPSGASRRFFGGGTNLADLQKIEDMLKEGVSFTDAIKTLYPEMSRWSGFFAQMMEDSVKDIARTQAMEMSDAWETALKTPALVEFLNQVVGMAATGPSTYPAFLSGEDQEETIARLVQAALEQLDRGAGGGRAFGGIDLTPKMVKIAEAGPEASIPLSRVPDVFARTIEQMGGAGAGSSRVVNIDRMEFVLPETAKDNEQAFAGAVRRILATEFLGMMREQRMV